MADVHDKETSYSKGRTIKGRDTSPELYVLNQDRVALRCSLSRKRVSGKPDIVLRKCSAFVFFVHGYHWRRHGNCKYAVLRKENTDLSREKLERNRPSDHGDEQRLQQLGWGVSKCETPDELLLSRSIQSIRAAA